MVLIPLLLIPLAGAHVLLVRVRGVRHPLPGRRPQFRSLLQPFSRAGRTDLMAARRAQRAAPQSEAFAPASIAGVRQPIDPAKIFVFDPLAKAAPTDRQLSAALS